MSHKIIKFGMLALVALALTYCQREDAPEAPQQDPVPAVDPQAVVSLNEAKSLFEASENQKRTANSVSRRKYPFIELETDWRYFEQTQTLVGDAYSKIPVTIVGSDLSAEMLFLKEDGVTEPYLFITEPDSLTNDNRIVNADFYLLTPKGEFISAYRMTDGVISHQLVPKVKANYRLVVDAEVAQTGRKKPKKTKGTPASIRVEAKTEDSGGLDDKSGGGGAGVGTGGGTSGGFGGGTGGGFGGDAPIQLETVNVYGTRPVHYGSYPIYNTYGNGIVKEKKRKLGENGIGGGNGGDSGSRSSDVGVGIAKNMKTIDDEEDMIIDFLTNPCAKALVDKAPTLANDIATLLNNTFGMNSNVNITFYNKSLGNTTDVAETRCSGSPDGKNSTLNCDVYLNDDIISDASQEYILATIYHEVVHAFLRYEQLILDEKDFNQRYPFIKEEFLYKGNGQRVKKYIFMENHERFAPFVEKLAHGIMSLPNTNISLEVARAMAKKGVVEESSLSEREIYLNEQQKTGKSGMTCTPKTP